MAWIEGRLRYNYDNERYGLFNSIDIWEHEGFHCGDHLQVKIEGEWIDTCMEMKWPNVWYLVGTKIEGNTIEHTIARIKRHK